MKKNNWTKLRSATMTLLAWVSLSAGNAEAQVLSPGKVPLPVLARPTNNREASVVAGQNSLAFNNVFSGQQGGAKVRGNLVIRNEKEWRRVFEIAVSGLMYKPELPEVDFQKKMVVAILLGEQLAIDRGVRVRNVYRTATEVQVAYEATPGSTRDSAGMAVVTTTQPFFFFAIDRAELPVRFLDKSSEAVTRQITTEETASFRAPDPGGHATGNLADVASADHVIVQRDQYEVVKGSEQGLRVLGDATGQNRIAVNMVWVVCCALLTLFALLGYGLMVSGLGPEKHSAYTLTVFLLLPLVTLFSFWLCGWAFLYGAADAVPDLGGLGPVTVSGGRLEGPLGSVVALRGFLFSAGMYDAGVGTMFLLQCAYAASAIAIPTAVLAGRLKPLTLLGMALVMAAVSYPVLGHWTLGGGWLAQLGQTNRSSLGCGFVDLAGAGSIHIYGALTALAGVRFLGPELDRTRPGHKLSLGSRGCLMATLGAFLLLPSWIGTTGGALYGAAGEGNLRLGLLAVTTLLGGAGGALANTAVHAARFKKLSPAAPLLGLLSGLVSISACAAFVPPTTGLLVGALGAILAAQTGTLLETRKFNDALGLISIHLVCGIWSLLSVGLFADGTFGNGWNNTLINRQPVPLVGLLYGGLPQAAAQFTGVVATALWSLGSAWVLFSGLRYATKGLRVNGSEESQGRDFGTLGLQAPVPASNDSIYLQSVVADDATLPALRPTGKWNGRTA